MENPIIPPTDLELEERQPFWLRQLPWLCLLLPFPMLLPFIPIMNLPHNHPAMPALGLCMVVSTLAFNLCLALMLTQYDKAAAKLWGERLVGASREAVLALRDDPSRCARDKAILTRWLDQHYPQPLDLS